MHNADRQREREREKRERHEIVDSYSFSNFHSIHFKKQTTRFTIEEIQIFHSFYIYTIVSISIEASFPFFNHQLA